MMATEMKHDIVMPEIVVYSPGSPGHLYLALYWDPKKKAYLEPPIFGRSVVEAQSRAMDVWRRNAEDEDKRAEESARSAPNISTLKEFIVHSRNPEPEPAPKEEPEEELPNRPRAASGTMWVYHPDKKERKRIAPADLKAYLAKGYERGRG